MGKAWLATDLVLDRTVALKTLAAVDEVDAFRAEFALLAGVVHPHLVQVHDLGHERLAGGNVRHYYTATHVEGEALAGWARGRSVGEAARALADVADALRCLHALGIRHGDVKSE